MDYDRTDIARRYDVARAIPPDTLRHWLDAIARRVPPGEIQRIMDVGCGTGRFSAALAVRFDADVIGIDPSRTMLEKARENCRGSRARFALGDAASLPVADGSICLLYLSMVYHHIHDSSAAAREFHRTLRPGGFLCIRNSTRDRLDRVPYLKFFPEAIEPSRKRLPSHAGVIETIRSGGFGLLRHEVIERPFAESLAEYCEKIAGRALSDLAALPDAAFEAGLQRMKQAVAAGSDPGPIVEPIDLFTFQKDSEPTATGN